MAWQRYIRMMNALRKARSGASMVEFALALPIFVLLLLGVAEVGRAILHYHIINKALRDSTRYLGRVPVTCPAVGTANGSVNTVGNATTANNLAMTGSLNGGSNLIDYWTSPTTITIEVDCLDNSAAANLCGLEACAGGPILAVVRMRADVVYQDLGFLSVFGLGQLTFNADHEEVSIPE